MDNLVKLFSLKKYEGEEAFEKLMDLAFEEEIWYII
jgi:hypothetical protein